MRSTRGCTYFRRSRGSPAIAGRFCSRVEGGGDVEILVLTFWSSMKVVESFAGSPPDAAVVEPEAQAVLIDYDHTVQHYETTEAYGELFTA